jgi:hypothetical protein
MTQVAGNSKVIRIKESTEAALKALRTREHETLDTVIWRLILEAKPEVAQTTTRGGKAARAESGRAAGEAEGLIDP